MDAVTVNAVTQPVPAAWLGVLADVHAAAGPGPEVNLIDTSNAHTRARAAAGGALIGPFCVPDIALPHLRGFAHPLHVTLTGGAGQVSGAAGLAMRLGHSLAGIEIGLRDVDDVAGNVRRVVAAVDAARGEGVLDEETPVHVEIPVDAPAAAWGNPSAGWLAAADEASAAELRLTLRLAGSHADRFASAATVAAWFDAALDRELPLRLVGASARAVTGGGVDSEGAPVTEFGFANALLALRRSFDSAGTDVVVETLTETDPGVVGAWVAQEPYLASTRRWLTSWAAPAGTSAADAVAVASAGLAALTAG